MYFLLFSLLLSGLAFAQKNDLTHRPKSFGVTSGKAVFVDFITADYDITYDIPNQKAFATARIKFNAPEAGLPVFDSVEAPSSMVLDNETITSTQVKTPANETTVRYMNKVVQTGLHIVEMKLPLTSLVSFTNGSVKSAFWTSDLDEREFLERYLPANLEYDQVKMTFRVNFLGAKARQKIYTNGVVNEEMHLDKIVYVISYPEYFNTSSIFFHTVPEGSTSELVFSLKSIDGREIPSVVYVTNALSSRLESLKANTEKIFQELERDYGAWPHPSIIVYNAGMGGMEYCGATMTDTGALGHELFQSYFARGVMPANGNAGWLDEALASWRDDGYQTLSTLSGSSGMSSHAYYTRTTDTAAYSFGARFMGLLDGKTKSKGGLKPFMRYMVDEKKFAPLFVEDFMKEMNGFYGTDFAPLFKQYTFGSGNNFSMKKMEKSHIHRKMSLEELQKYL